MNLLYTFLLLTTIVCQNNVVAENVNTFWNTIKFFKEQNYMDPSSIIFLSDANIPVHAKDFVKVNMSYDTHLQEKIMMLNSIPNNYDLDTLMQQL